jgi:hypothetical protein
VESLLTEKAAVEEAPKVDKKMPVNNKDTAGAESMTRAYEQDLTESEVEISSNILSHAGASVVCDPTEKPPTDGIAVELEEETSRAPSWIQ